MWATLSEDEPFSRRFEAVGHKDIAQYTFRGDDRVWIFSYSRKPIENEELLANLKRGGAKNAIYLSTATTNVAALTSCYEYPSTKLAAERCARSLLNAKILTIGVVCKTEADLPGGTTMATRLDMLKDFMCKPYSELHDATNLFEPIQRPFGSSFEKSIYSAYGVAMRLCRRLPCVLRPVDYVLRALGWRWYGYLFLSNQLWSTTTSS